MTHTTTALTPARSALVTAEEAWGTVENRARALPWGSPERHALMAEARELEAAYFELLDATYPAVAVLGDDWPTAEERDGDTSRDEDW